MICTFLKIDSIYFSDLITHSIKNKHLYETKILVRELKTLSST